MSQLKKILAIETSCDETAIAIAEFFGSRTRPIMRTRSHIVLSQIGLHARFGGVVPNLARREHEKNLVPILIRALREARLLKRETIIRGTKLRVKAEKEIESILEREPDLLKLFKKHLLPLHAPNIDAIAVTSGPGLAPALWAGVNFARALARLWGKPLIPTNHMAGHFFSAFLQKNAGDPVFCIPHFAFPILALLVSGNHTEIALVKKPWQFRVLGQTHDDAAGEAFDKIARIMGFPYPGGPAISRLAEKGDAKKYPLPSPMLHSKNYDFSFSGLKTAALYRIRDITGSLSWKTKAKLTPRQKADIAASFESAAVNVLVKKTLRAAEEYKAKTVLLGGGVSANKLLRSALGGALKDQTPLARFLLPDLTLAGDNALMIATAAYFCGKKKALDKVRAEPNLRLGQ